MARVFLCLIYSVNPNVALGILEWHLNKCRPDFLGKVAKLPHCSVSRNAKKQHCSYKVQRVPRELRQSRIAKWSAKRLSCIFGPLKNSENIISKSSGWKSDLLKEREEKCTLHMVGRIVPSLSDGPPPPSDPWGICVVVFSATVSDPCPFHRTTLSSPPLWNMFCLLLRVFWLGFSRPPLCLTFDCLKCLWSLWGVIRLRALPRAPAAHNWSPEPKICPFVPRGRVWTFTKRPSCWKEAEPFWIVPLFWSPKYPHSVCVHGLSAPQPWEHFQTILQKDFTDPLEFLSDSIRTRLTFLAILFPIQIKSCSTKFDIRWDS